jgi:uncharacterized damage-inducible protein DinB
MHLTIQELLAYTDEERRRWESWFRDNGDEMFETPIAGPLETTIGQLVMHIFGGELRVVQFLRNEPTVKYRNLPSRGIAEVFGMGIRSRQAMRDFVAGLAPADWDRIVEFPDGGGSIRATVRKAIAHICIHEIRHWAQIATLVRERGFAPPGDHDLLLSSALE